MRSKTPRKKIWVMINGLGVTLALILFILIFFLGLPDNNSYTKPDLPPDQTASAFAKEQNFKLPVRIKIPKINVDAAVEQVGLTTQGNMDAPNGPVDVAWFNLSPRPGEVGNSVFAGHFGWKNNIPAVFDNLHQLRNGDKLYIEDELGTVVSFVVVDSKKYDSKASASEVFGSNDGRAHLNLITCQGIWNQAKKSYSDRLVVFTDQIMEQ